MALFIAIVHSTIDAYAMKSDAHKKTVALRKMLSFNPGTKSSHNYGKKSRSRSRSTRDAFLLAADAESMR
jgi:hypothetical protein